jgi:hypothetical protein
MTVICREPADLRPAIFIYFNRAISIKKLRKSNILSNEALAHGPQEKAHLER